MFNRLSFWKKVATTTDPTAPSQAPLAAHRFSEHGIRDSRDDSFFMPKQSTAILVSPFGYRNGQQNFIDNPPFPRLSLSGSSNNASDEGYETLSNESAPTTATSLNFPAVSDNTIEQAILEIRSVIAAPTGPNTPSTSIILAFVLGVIFAPLVAVAKDRLTETLLDIYRHLLMDANNSLPVLSLASGVACFIIAQITGAIVRKIFEPGLENTEVGFTLIRFIFSPLETLSYGTGRLVGSLVGPFVKGVQSGSGV